MPTPDAVENQIARFLAAGYPHAPSAQTVELTVGVWLDDLDDLDDRDLDAACRAYRRSPDPADRWWPTPGRLRALSSLGRSQAHLGSATDAEAAFDFFATRLRHLGFRPDRDDPARHLDPADPARNDAMFVALTETGGVTTYRMAPTPTADAIGHAQLRRRWVAAYVDARKVQAADPAIVRLTAQSTELVPRG